MLNCAVTERLGIKWLRLEGRIDSLTSPELQRQVNALIPAGEHVLMLDFEQASYISSAGMRILMAAHKQLVKVGGRLTIHKPCPNVRAVFDISGTTSLFEIVESFGEIIANGQVAQPVNTVQGRWNHIAYECQRRDAASGRDALMLQYLNNVSIGYDKLKPFPAQAIRLLKHVPSCDRSNTFGQGTRPTRL